MANAIVISGLREFRNSLRKMDGESQKKLRLVFNEAGQVIVEATKAKIPVLTGAARASVRAVSKQSQGIIKAGGAKVPYYGWLDFGGGSVGRNDSVYRASVGKDGRYLYPSYNENKAKVRALVEKGLVELAEEAGIKVD